MQGLLKQFMDRRRCPQDGARLTGRLGWCRVCRSTWAPLFDGTGAPEAEPFGADAVDPGAYLRRKLHEFDNHRLSPEAPPPRALSRLQGGRTLFNPTGARRLAEATRRRDLDTPLLGRQF